MKCLLHYANFLEMAELEWFTFPLRKADRCLIQYRGFLIRERDAGKLMPSTVSEYMRSAISFYRWALSHGLLDVTTPLWRDKAVYVRFFDSVGFERTILRLTTDLSIPNKTHLGLRLEDGLLPVSAADREALLELAKTSSSQELYRMLALGFFTGMRLGSICDLKIQTLENAVEDPVAKGLFCINIGPGASPPVRTKFGVTGRVWIPKPLLDDLLEYANSLRRSKRQARATSENKYLVFLTRYGNPYCANDSEQSTSVNTEMVTFRRKGMQAGIKVASSFHFHQSRCTFATELATIALSTTDPINAIALVRDALLHKDEATSLKYIKFVTQTPAKQAAANEFTRAFMGINNADKFQP
ncbi:site-specific integrase [Herbaspirillum sp. meg3]|uniref:site-specific integrase n=1 Tax=Herbaspirillum sp. meg3 TaxID=2025949 RepID=UPI001E2825C9|nr:site-specific integrase [Herbaspirillum sp. meg3]